MSKAKNSMDERTRFWQMVFETFHQSNLSVRQFCREEGLSESGFYYWRRRLAGDSNKTSRPARDKHPDKIESAKSSPGFIEVSLPEGNSGVELVLSSGNVLRFGCRIDKGSLARIVSVLRDFQLC